MKYENYRIYHKHWGGGYTEIFQVDDCQIEFNVSTGSYTTIHRTGVPLDRNDGTWHCEWHYAETQEQCIDRLLDKANNPEHHLEWYERVPSDYGSWYPTYDKLCHTADDSIENKAKIESGTTFVGWYADYWNRVREENAKKYQKS